MSDSLRSQVVEAMAQVIHSDGTSLRPAPCGVCSDTAEAALDAALNVLGEQVEGDGWIYVDDTLPVVDTIPGLLSVLRGN